MRSRNAPVCPQDTSARTVGRCRTGRLLRGHGRQRLRHDMLNQGLENTRPCRVAAYVAKKEKCRAILKSAVFVGFYQPVHSDPDGFSKAFCDQYLTTNCGKPRGHDRGGEGGRPQNWMTWRSHNCPSSLAPPCVGGCFGQFRQTPIRFRDACGEEAR